MNTIEIIRKRRSYRGEYKLDRVPREDLITIMEAGLAAPSGCNKQITSLICVDDSDVLKQIHSVIDPPIAESAPSLICVITQRINAYRDKLSKQRRSWYERKGVFRDFTCCRETERYASSLYYIEKKN